MKNRVWIVGSMALAGLALAAPIKLPPLESFDGKSYAGITIGKTTDLELKKMFDRESNAFRPEAYRPKRVKEEKWRLDALLNGRGTKAVVSGLHFDLAAAPIALADWLPKIEGGMQPYYLRGRHDDWAVYASSARGMLMVVQGTGENAKITRACLVSPYKVATAIEDLEPNPTEIEPLQTTFTTAELAIPFEDVSVQFTTDKVALNNSSRLRRDTESEIFRELRRFKWVDSESGNRDAQDVEVKVDFDYDDKRDRMRISVTIQLSGSNPLGEVSASGDASREWKDVTEQPLIRDYDAIERLVNDALDEFEDRIESAIKGQKRPTLDGTRENQWREIVNRTTATL